MSPLQIACPAQAIGFLGCFPEPKTNRGGVCKEANGAAKRSAPETLLCAGRDAL